jgi:hypothetical protein
VLQRIFEPLLLPSRPHPSRDADSESEEYFPLNVSQSIASKIRSAAADVLLCVGGCKHTLQTTREQSFALYRQFKAAGFEGRGVVCDAPSLFSLLPAPSCSFGPDANSQKKSSGKAVATQPLPGIRKRHDTKSQLIAKSKKKALAEFMKLRQGCHSGTPQSALSPRACAKLLKVKMLRSR